MMDFPNDPDLIKVRTEIEMLADAVDCVDETHIHGMPWNRTRVRGGILDGESGQRGGVSFVTISNGAIKAEASHGSPYLGLDRMAAMTYRAAKLLRKAIRGPARLTWRDFSHESGVSLWVRLAFEPL